MPMAALRWCQAPPVERLSRECGDLENGIPGRAGDEVAAAERELERCVIGLSEELDGARAPVPSVRAGQLIGCMHGKGWRYEVRWFEVATVGALWSAPPSHELQWSLDPATTVVPPRRREDQASLS